MTKDDFIAWHSDPVTQEYIEALISTMNGLVEDVVASAGLNSLTDRYRAGQIEALKLVIDWQPIFDRDEVEEEEEDDA